MKHRNSAFASGRSVALIALLGMITFDLPASAGTLDDISAWVNEQAEVVTDAASEVGSYIGQKAEAVGTWINGNVSVSGSWIGQSASMIGDWVGENASAAGSWIIENGTIIGAWIGDTVSGVGMWIGGNSNAVGTCIGTTANGISIWVSDTAVDIGTWIKRNAAYAADGIALFGSELESLLPSDAGDAERIVEDIYRYVENVDPEMFLSSEYYVQSGEKFLLGDYSTAPDTELSIALNVVASIVNVDIVLDIRDLAYDIQYIGDGSIGIVQLGIDAASCLPVIGVIKNVRFINGAVETIQAVDKLMDISQYSRNAITLIENGAK